MKALLALVLIAAVAGAAWAYRDERDQRRSDVARLASQVQAMKGDLATTKEANAVLAARLRSLSRRQLKAKLARTTLAARVKRSVFTVTVSLDEGTGFVAWVQGRNSYVITANHVVVLSVARGEYGARVHSGSKVWLGRIVKTDENNDLALIKVPRRIGPPLWQRPIYVPPLVGDELLLVGSPLGYEGSVSSGVVGRISPKELQTDAAAYPGISGGPAVDAEGQVVGVLVSGEGENLNFAVPINLACVKLRRCAGSKRRS